MTDTTETEKQTFMSIAWDITSLTASEEDKKDPKMLAAIWWDNFEMLKDFVKEQRHAAAADAYKNLSSGNPMY